MYLDPGFGGMLIQIIVALIAAGGAIAFSMRKKIKAMFSKNKAQTEPLKPASETKTNDSDADVVDMLSNDDEEDDDDD